MYITITHNDHFNSAHKHVMNDFDFGINMYQFDEVCDFVEMMVRKDIRVAKRYDIKKAQTKTREKSAVFFLFFLCFSVFFLVDLFICF